MILSCPSCKTQFNVPDGAITTDGRKVRCANCQHVWHATTADAVKPAPPRPQAVPRPMPQPQYQQAAGQQLHNPYAGQAGLGDSPDSQDPEVAERMAAIRREMMAGAGPDPEDMNIQTPDVDAAPGDISEDDGSADPEESVDERPSDLDDVLVSIRAAAGEASTDILEDDEDEFIDDDDDALARLSARSRRENEYQAENKRRGIMFAFWVLLALIWIGLPTLVFGFPEFVRSVWPASSVLYDAIGSASDVERFREGAETLTPSIADEPEVVEALLETPRTEERAGQIALILTGYVENKGRRSARVPKLRISVLDSRGQVIDTWDFDPPGRVITRGQRVRFEQVRAPVPPGANQAIVSIIEGAFSETEAESRL